MYGSERYFPQTVCDLIDGQIETFTLERNWLMKHFVSTL
jgi:hypothetical protein